jgi:hypothetical protein
MATTALVRQHLDCRWPRANHSERSTDHCHSISPKPKSMIKPDDIRRKAESLYREYVQAWLAGDDAFFPKEIRGRKTPRSEDLAEASQAVRTLRAGSKECAGFGYSVQWREVRSRTFGRNEFPERILFESAADLLQFLDRSDEFNTFVNSTTKLRSRFPALERWIQTNIRTVLEIAPDLDGLLEVVSWFAEHPRPGQFARELPLTVDTKFIERHERVLAEWFDLVLPPHTIRSDEDHFERRFGLRYAEPHLLLRFLDPKLQTAAGFPCGELSLPLRTLDHLACSVTTVFIVENKVNLLTLPPFESALALGGLGNGVSVLRHVHCLRSTPIRYWGDIDIEGYAILSMLRALFPQVQSFLMDQATIDRHERLVVAGTGRKLAVPAYLNEAEQALFIACRNKNHRLEQERIPQPDVVAALASLASK